MGRRGSSRVRGPRAQRVVEEDERVRQSGGGQRDKVDPDQPRVLAQVAVDQSEDVARARRTLADPEGQQVQGEAPQQARREARRGAGGAAVPGKRRAHRAAVGVRRQRDSDHRSARRRRRRRCRASCGCRCARGLWRAGRPVTSSPPRCCDPSLGRPSVAWWRLGGRFGCRQADFAPSTMRHGEGVRGAEPHTGDGAVPIRPGCGDAELSAAACKQGLRL